MLLLWFCSSGSQLGNYDCSYCSYWFALEIDAEFQSKCHILQCSRVLLFFFDVQSCTSGLKTQASCSRATMMIKGMENHLIGGDAERAGTLQPGEEESLGESYQCV